MKTIIFGVRVEQLDSHAHCRVFVNHASAGKIVLRREELPSLLHHLGLEQSGEILADTETALKEEIRSMFEGLDKQVPYELCDFGGWRPLL